MVAPLGVERTMTVLAIAGTAVNNATISVTIFMTSTPLLSKKKNRYRPLLWPEAAVAVAAHQAAPLKGNDHAERRPMTLPSQPRPLPPSEPAELQGSTHEERPEGWKAARAAHDVAANSRMLAQTTFRGLMKPHSEPKGGIVCSIYAAI